MNIKRKVKWTRLQKLLYLDRLYKKRVKREENSDVPPAP